VEESVLDSGTGGGLGGGCHQCLTRIVGGNGDRTGNLPADAFLFETAAVFHGCVQRFTDGRDWFCSLERNPESRGGGGRAVGNLSKPGGR